MSRFFKNRKQLIISLYILVVITLSIVVVWQLLIKEGEQLFLIEDASPVVLQSGSTGEFFELNEVESQEIVDLLNKFRYQKSYTIDMDGWSYGLSVLSSSGEPAINVEITSENEIGYNGRVYYSTAKHGLYELVANMIN